MWTARNPARPPNPPGRRRRGTGLVAAVAVSAAAMLVRPSPAVAHETDQFTLPAEDDLADLGPDVTRWYYQAVAEGVRRANVRIAAALRAGQSDVAVAKLQSAVEVVNAVDGTFERGNDIVDDVERELASDEMRRRHPGQRVFYRESDDNIYQDAFSIFDLRIFSRFWFGSTVKVFGHLVGTDKFGHFSAIGVSYYFRYAAAIRGGATEGEAKREAVRFGTTGKWSEADLLGLTTTGDYANGDLAANYAGFLFFRNLTEPVPVAGAVRPPLLVRDGPYWRLAAHVRADSDFFRPFVTDHWNEALNPGWFIESMRPALRDAVRARTDRILHFYAPPALAGYTADALRAYFRDRRLRLATYWGDDYGHRGGDASMVTIDNACFDLPPASRAERR